MKERIRIGVSKNDQFDLDFIDGELPAVYDMVIGRHHVCNGFITKTATSRGLKYFLVCGKCCLRVEIPEALKRKQALLGFFTERGFHRLGEELNICLDCEGTGVKRLTEYEDGEELRDNMPRTVTKEITKTIPCPKCKSTGILKKPVIV